jgi:hypothetical protein
VTKGDRVLIDTNAIIEAVRTGCWPAVTGQLRLETVETCRQEALTGPATPVRGYVTVSEEDLRRLASVHAVDAVVRAAVKLEYDDADGLDAGEHDLLAHAHGLSDDAWVVCSPDKASIRAATALGFGSQLCSLEELVVAVGARPRSPLRAHFRTEWLVSFRTKVLLEGY